MRDRMKGRAIHPDRWRGLGRCIGRFPRDRGYGWLIDNIGTKLVELEAFGALACVFGAPEGFSVDIGIVGAHVER
jgi:hypothetical protein